MINKPVDGPSTKPTHHRNLEEEREGDLLLEFSRLAAGVAGDNRDFVASTVRALQFVHGFSLSAAQANM